MEHLQKINEFLDFLKIKRPTLGCRKYDIFLNILTDKNGNPNKLDKLMVEYSTNRERLHEDVIQYMKHLIKKCDIVKVNQLFGDVPAIFRETGIHISDKKNKKGDVTELTSGYELTRTELSKLIDDLEKLANLKA